MNGEKENPETLKRQIDETAGKLPPVGVVEKLKGKELALAPETAGMLDSYRQAISIANQMLKYAFGQKIGRALRFGKQPFLDGDMALSIAKNIPTFDVITETNPQTGLAFWKDIDQETGEITFFAQATAEWKMMDKKMQGIVGSACTGDKFWKSRLEKSPDQRSRIYQDMIGAAQKRAKRRAILQVLGLAGISEAKLKELGLVISAEDSVSFREG